MDEKKAYSQRLVAALKKAGVTTTSPTRLAMEFNLHHRGRPVTPQGVHRWLLGSSIPSQDKIRTLAEWLNISPEWLRFGGVEKKVAEEKTTARRTIAPQLLSDLADLNDEHLTIVRELVCTLLRLEGERRSRP